MEGKIFSFDLQRFDGEVWSMTSAEGQNLLVYGTASGGAIDLPGASLVATQQGDASAWSLGGSTMTSVILDLSAASNTSLANSIGGSSSDITNFYAGGFSTGDFYFKLNSGNKLTSIAGGASANSIDASERTSANLTITGGTSNDIIRAGKSGTFYLNGGSSGKDILVGGNGTDYFIYGGSGTPSISSFRQNQDFISLTSSAALPGADKVTTNANGDLVLDFDTNNSLSIAGASAGTVKLIPASGNATYYYTKDYISDSSSYNHISLTAGTETFSALGSNFSTKAVSIDASGSTLANGVKITLNNQGDYVIGSASGGVSITGGTGADIISLKSDNFKADLFYYNGGADSIKGFGANDSIQLSGKGLSFVTDGNNLESLNDSDKEFKLTFGTGKSLTFSVASADTAVSIYGSSKSDTTPYEYTATAISINGGEGNKNKVTLGSSFTETKFDGSNFSVISAAAVIAGGTAGFSIKGGSNASSIYGSDKVFTSITGSDNGDTLAAGSVGAYLYGGKGADLLIGGSGADSFYYTEGTASIQNYTYDSDKVSIANSLTAPLTFDTTKESHASYSGSDYVVSLGSGSSITFKAKQQFALVKDSDTYTYTPNSIALNTNGGQGISIGGSYYTSKTFNGASDANSGYETIYAAEVGHAIKVTGNDNANYMVASSLYGGTLLGGLGQDTLVAGSVGAYMDGGDGEEHVFIGSSGTFTDTDSIKGADTFVYRGNAASIQNYGAGDIVNFAASDITITDAKVSSKTNEEAGSTVNISLQFGGDDAIVFQNLTSGQAEAGVSLKSGRNNTYVYYKDKVILNDKSVTLTAAPTGNSYSAKDSITTINAQSVILAADTTLSIGGNGFDNYIIGSTIAGNSLSGGAGHDTLVGSAGKGDIFDYTAGNDVIIGFDDKDKFSIGSDNLNAIKSAKAGKNNLTFKLGGDISIVFRSNDTTEVPSRISLNGTDGGFLTKDGVVSKISENSYSLKLFSNAKGTIDLNDTSLYNDTKITSINASAAEKQSVTFIAKSSDASVSYTFADNKRRDTFEYAGGKVSISGFESGKDRLNIVNASITSFSISGNATTGGDVIITLNGGSSDIISLHGAQGNEVLVRANGARGYSKMVFSKPGVLENKAKNSTSVTLAANATGNYEAGSTVKKIFVTDIGEGISITAGAKGSVINASEAGKGVSIISGAKNDQFTGSSGNSDLFYFNKVSGGKDIINAFDASSDSISFGGSADVLSTAKISTSNKAIKFKFDKNVLTVKGDSIKDAQLKIDGTNYSYSKNAIISTDGQTASLTSNFGGTYKISGDVHRVEGAGVTKNLTYKVTSSGTDETLSGGTKKTTFKGAGGTDSLIGGKGDDIFFYSKGDTGTATIADFDVSNDKLKIAGGTLRKIESLAGGGISFNMSATNKKDDPAIGYFQIKNFASYDKSGEGTTTTTTEVTSDVAKKTLFHANNTYYWFAQEEITEPVTVDGVEGTATIAKAGDLITWSDKKVSSSQAKDYAVIELNYGTNLARSGVATLVSSKNDKATLPGA